MQKHVLRHKCGQSGATFDVEAVLANERDKFGPIGQIEVASEEFLVAATAGEIEKIKDALDSGRVYVDVADKNGHTALIAAGVCVYNRSSMKCVPVCV